MNVQEQHIEVNLSAQKIASNVFRKLDPSEIDWILNKMVDRYIKDRIKEDKDSLGFDATQIDLDALRTLVVIDRFIDVYKIDATQSEVFGDLPGDYSYLIDNSSLVLDKCSIYYPTASRFSNKTKYLYAFTPAVSTKADSPYYKTVQVTLGGNVILNKAIDPGLAVKEELFTFNRYLLDQLWDLKLSGVEFYWEKYNDTYIRGAFIVVCDAAQAGTNSILIDALNAQAAVASTLIRSYAPIATGGVRVRPNRLIRGQVRSNVLGGTFTGTSINSPIAAITGNKLKVYYAEKFIVNKLKVSYIRKPRKISLSLAQDCDLPEEFHMQICDMAVLYIKELTTNPDWEIKLQDNMMNKN